MQILYQGLRDPSPGIARGGQSRPGKSVHWNWDRDTQQRRSIIKSPLGKDTAGWPEIQTEGFAESLVNAAFRLAEDRSLDLTEYRGQTSGEFSQLRWWNSILADGVSTSQGLEAIQQHHQK